MSTYSINSHNQGDHTSKKYKSRLTDGIKEGTQILINGLAHSIVANGNHSGMHKQ